MREKTGRLDIFRRLLVVVAIVALAPLAQAGEPSPEALITRLMSIWENGETKGLAAIMSQEVVYEDLPNGRSLEGLDAAASYISHVHTWATEIHIDLTRVFGNSTEAAAEWTMTAIQSKPIPGRVPVATNRPITIRGITVITVEEGKILRAVDSFDALGFVLQLGATVDLPGGARIPPG